MTFLNERAGQLDAAKRSNRYWPMEVEIVQLVTTSRFQVRHLILGFTQLGNHAQPNVVTEQNRRYYNHDFAPQFLCRISRIATLGFVAELLITRNVDLIFAIENA